jgi:hypothetical protein
MHYPPAITSRPAIWHTCETLTYLDKPVEEILQSLYHVYAKELSYYQIKIRA